MKKFLHFHIESIGRHFSKLNVSQMMEFTSDKIKDIVEKQKMITPISFFTQNFQMASFKWPLRVIVSIW